MIEISWLLNIFSVVPCNIIIILHLQIIQVLIKKVCIVTGYGLESPGKIFDFSTASRPTLGLTYFPIQWVPGALSPVVKRQGREAEHSPPI
jgi:hypothetical protein